MLLPRLLTTSVLVVLASCGGNRPASSSSSAPAEDPPQPSPFIGVRTSAPESLVAGSKLEVQCLLVDRGGEAVTPSSAHMPSIRVDPVDSVVNQAGHLIVQRAGQIAVACEFPDLGLADPAPSVVQVLAGPAAAIGTTLDRSTVVAGEEVRATCAAVDAFGNPVQVKPTLRVSPADPGGTVTGLTASFQRAGSYLVVCDVPGASATPAQVEVVPAGPAHLSMEALPAQKVYARDQVIEMRTSVVDSFGNTVATPVTLDSAGAGQRLGELRLRFPDDGVYTLTARVQGTGLVTSLTLRVDSTAPSIVCQSPANGEILDLAPGAVVTFLGSVTDATGVSSVTVNGSAVALNPDGSFTYPLATTFGVNFVDIAARDPGGAGSTTTCAFLAAHTWAGAALADSISLQLRQAAIDDTKRTPPITSLADMLAAALGSGGLKDTLDSSLKASNPLKAGSCDQQACIPFGGPCVCLISSQFDYLDNRLPGPDTASLSLVDGGLPGTISFQKPGIRLRVRGSALGIPFDTSGWIDFASVDAKLTFDMKLDAGRPRISVRPGSVSVGVGTISASFDGIPDLVTNLVMSLAGGTLRSTLSSTIQSFVSSGLDSLLDGVLSGLDIASLGSTWDVPKPGGGSIPLRFGASFTSLSVTRDRVLLGIGTSFTGQQAGTGNDRGAPLQPGAVLLDPRSTTPMAAAVHIGVLAQAVHAMAAGGFFDTDLDASGLTVSLKTSLPPAVYLQDGRLVMALGAMKARVALPPLLPALDGWLGMKVSLAPSLTDGKLVLGDLRVDELHVSLDGLDGSGRSAIEPLLSDLLSQLVGQALGGALPALPLPSFTLPDSVATFGLPKGAVFGLIDPALTVSDRHLVLTGASELK